MLYQTYIPPPPLSAFVSLIWLHEGYTTAHTKERLLPDGSVELVINLRDDRLLIYDRQHHEQFQSFPGSLICGPHSEFFVIDTASQQAVMGVHFKPGGAFPFLNLPADQLRDVHLSLDTLWGTAAVELRERLLEAPTPQARFDLLEQALLRQATRPLTRHPAVTFALQEFRNIAYPRTVADVTAQIGLSSRHFIQLFSQEVGLTPKLFWRVRRFQAVLRCLEKGQSVAWTDIAARCGYFDQAHFIHDFQAFSGLNPTAYLTQRSEHTNHVPLPG